MLSSTNSNQRFLPDWVILGDHSRMILLDWLLSGVKWNHDENSVIWIRYGMKLSIVKQGAQWIIETPVLLPRTTLCLPPSDGFGVTVDTSSRTRFAVLEEFPFRKQSSMDLVRKLQGDENETLVVLMDLPRRQGSTDLIAPGEDVHQAMEAYQAERCNVLTMENTGKLPRMLHWHRPMYDTWVEKFRNDLSDLCERISEIPYDYASLEEDWQDDGGLLQEQTMDRLFSYQNAKREKGGSLWDRYAAAAKRAMFPAVGQGPLAPVESLYRDCLDSPLVFWPVDADAGAFMNDLQNAFLKKLEAEEAKGGYRKKTQVSGRLDEETYFGLAARSDGNRSGTALNAVFSQSIKDYLYHDVKRYLQERLERRYKNLEGMIP